MSPGRELGQGRRAGAERGRGIGQVERRPDRIDRRVKIVAQGGSAGGTLIGAIANMRPDLYAGLIALTLTPVLCAMILKPHDHGESWAIYGQASEVTEMTDWKIVEKAEGDKPNLVEPVRTYTMKPGDQHLYDVHDVHSPRRDGPCRLIRIEGKNLDRVKRSNIKAK